MGLGSGNVAPMPRARKVEDQSFEQVLEGLEAVVQRLESGELSLDESLAAFEEGVKLSRIGTARLDSAERRVEELLAGGELAPLTDVRDHDDDHGHGGRAQQDEEGA